MNNEFDIDIKPALSKVLVSVRHRTTGGCVQQLVADESKVDKAVEFAKITLTIADYNTRE